MAVRAASGERASNASRMGRWPSRLSVSQPGTALQKLLGTNSSIPAPNRHRRGDWLREGALVCAIGANDPRSRELDAQVITRATLVCCDSLEDAKLESGDLIEPVAAGQLDWLEVHELHDIVAGEIPGRQSDDDVVLFKSNGIAPWDVAIGHEVVRRARDAGVGVDL